MFLADAVFEDLPGGSRTAARALARGLAARGHSVTFLVGRQNRDAPEAEEAEGIRVVRYPGAGRALEFVREGRQAASRLWAEAPFDLIHTHFAYAGLGPLQVIPGHVPRVRTFHGPWDEEGWIEDTAQERLGAAGWVNALVKRRIRAAVEARDIGRSDYVLTLSQCFRKRVLRRFRCNPEQVEVIAGGTDQDQFQVPSDKAAVRRQLGLPVDRRILLSIRRLTPRMGLERLISAVSVLRAHYPDILLLIGGQGPQRERLERQICRGGLTENVRLIGFVPEERLALHYQAADLFVLPTLALEGFGLVTTEALACGVPVIGTPAGATPEILNALDPLLIAPDVTCEGLVHAIRHYLDSDYPLALSPGRLHDFVQERYTWERHVQATEAVYRKLIHARAMARNHPGTQCIC